MHEPGSSRSRAGASLALLLAACGPTVPDFQVHPTIPEPRRTEAEALLREAWVATERCGTATVDRATEEAVRAGGLPLEGAELMAACAPAAALAPRARAIVGTDPALDALASDLASLATCVGPASEAAAPGVARASATRAWHHLVLAITDLRSHLAHAATDGVWGWSSSSDSPEAWRRSVEQDLIRVPAHVKMLDMWLPPEGVLPDRRSPPSAWTAYEAWEADLERRRGDLAEAALEGTEATTRARYLDAELEAVRRLHAEALALDQGPLPAGDAARATRARIDATARALALAVDTEATRVGATRPR